MQVHEMSRAERTARAAEFAGLILKLRWLGADDEAEELEKVLIRMAPRGFVILPESETD